MKIVTPNSNYTVQDNLIISKIIINVRKMLNESKIIIPNYYPLEISHHYGIKHFAKYGCVIINIINREYCKKIIVLFPGQNNPMHMHKLKEETFQVLNGNMTLIINECIHNLKAGELLTVEREMAHSFCSECGCIFEEISTTHNSNDSYYFDEEITKQNLLERKTVVVEWQM